MPERLTPARGLAEHADAPLAPEADSADAAPDAPQASPLPGAPETADADTASPASEEPAEPVSPATTAEIDVDEVEARLADPGSTQSFQAIPEDRIDTDSTYDAGTTVNLMWGARSDVGCVRTHNEDSYLVQSPLFCVSDGMGGHAAGEVALVHRGRDHRPARPHLRRPRPAGAGRRGSQRRHHPGGSRGRRAARHGVHRHRGLYRGHAARHRARGRLARLPRPRGHAHPRDARPLLCGGARRRRRDHRRRGARPSQPLCHHARARLRSGDVRRPLPTQYRGGATASSSARTASRP